MHGIAVPGYQKPVYAQHQFCADDAARCNELPDPTGMLAPLVKINYTS